MFDGLLRPSARPEKGTRNLHWDEIVDKTAPVAGGVSTGQGVTPGVYWPDRLRPDVDVAYA